MDDLPRSSRISLVRPLIVASLSLYLKIENMFLFSVQSSDPSWDSVLELLKKSRDVAIALEPSSFLMNQFDQALSVLTERPQQPSAV